MDQTSILREQMHRSQSKLLKSVQDGQRLFSETPQTNPYKRMDLEILKILKGLENALSRK